VVQANETITTRNPELVSYVLNTVLHNALTYSKPQDPIDVILRQTKNGTDITIADHGEGMPAAKIPELFQPFFKAEGAEKFNHEGMGFSLYLDKLIMEYLGGTISLVSQKGHGTTVTLHLPV
jgi:signal transduction histidine kinase